MSEVDAQWTEGLPPASDLLLWYILSQDVDYSLDQVLPWDGLVGLAFSQAQRYPRGQVQACIRNLEARPKSVSAVFEGAM